MLEAVIMIYLLFNPCINGYCSHYVRLKNPYLYYNTTSQKVQLFFLLVAIWQNISARKIKVHLYVQILQILLVFNLPLKSISFLLDHPILTTCSLHFCKQKLLLKHDHEIRMNISSCYPLSCQYENPLLLTLIRRFSDKWFDKWFTFFFESKCGHYSFLQYISYFEPGGTRICSDYIIMSSCCSRLLTNWILCIDLEPCIKISIMNPMPMNKLIIYHSMYSSNTRYMVHNAYVPID